MYKCPQVSPGSPRVHAQKSQTINNNMVQMSGGRGERGEWGSRGGGEGGRGEREEGGVSGGSRGASREGGRGKG